MVLTDNDESWKDALEGVIPLVKEERYTGRPKPKLKVTPKITPNQIYGGDKLEGLRFGETANIDANTAKKFKSGGFRLEAELDLHGFSEDLAYDKVLDFVKNSYIRGLRCIAVITGKGLHVQSDSDIFESRGVLKDRVPQWLNLPEIRPMILAISHPEPKDGGSGVVRILLRRHRDI